MLFRRSDENISAVTRTVSKTATRQPIRKRNSKTSCPVFCGFRKPDMKTSDAVNQTAAHAKMKRFLRTCFRRRATRSSRSMMGGIHTGRHCGEISSFRSTGSDAVHGPSSAAAATIFDDARSAELHSAVSPLKSAGQYNFARLWVADAQQAANLRSGELKICATVHDNFRLLAAMQATRMKLSDPQGFNRVLMNAATFQGGFALYTRRDKARESRLGSQARRSSCSTGHRRQATSPSSCSGFTPCSPSFVASPRLARNWPTNSMVRSSASALEPFITSRPQAMPIRR